MNSYRTNEILGSAGRQEIAFGSLKKEGGLQAASKASQENSRAN